MSYFNSREYPWVSVALVLFGKTVGGARAVEYKTKRQKEVLFAAGDKGRSVQKGKKEIEGSITVLQSEIIAMNRAAQEQGYDDVTDVDFDLIISYVPRDGGVITTDKILSASISEVSHNMKEGDLYQEHALPFIALDSVYNVL